MAQRRRTAAVIGRPETHVPSKPRGDALEGPRAAKMNTGSQTGVERLKSAKCLRFFSALWGGGTTPQPEQILPYGGGDVQWT